MSDFTGMYRAAVHDINDPENRGRLRLLVPGALGDAPSAWAEPALPTSDTVAWMVGDKVWALFEDGDVNRPVYISRMGVVAEDITPGAVTPGAIGGGVTPTATVTPTISPLGYSGVLIRWSPISNPNEFTKYRVLFDTVNPPAQELGVIKGTMAATSVLPNGTALVSGVTYYAQIIVMDVDVAGPPGPVVSGGPVVVPADAVSQDVLVTNSLFSRDGYFGTLSATQISTGNLQAVYALLGTLLVGSNITISEAGGIVITLADGGVIKFPSDGSDAIITAIMRAKELVVENHLTVRGVSNKIEGGLSLAAGVTAPTVPPNVVADWDYPAARFDLYDSAGLFHNGYADHGLWWTGTEWAFTSTRTFPDVYMGTNTFSSTTGLPTGGASTGTFKPFGGIVKIGTSWYVLGQDTARTGSPWYVFIYNSSWVKTGEWLFSTTTNLKGIPMLTTDGTNIQIAYVWKADGSLRLNTNTPSGATAAPFYILDASWSGNDVLGLYVGSADFGAVRVVAANLSSVRVYGYNTGLASGATQARYSTNDWTPAGGIEGLAWDGTVFRSLHSDGAIWKYGMVTATTTRDYAYSYYDSDPAGNGPVGAAYHETQPGPPVTKTFQPRTYIRFEVTAPNDMGGADDADSVRIYIDNHRQSTLGPGVTGVTYDVPNAAGAAPTATNEFATVPITPGMLRSTSTDSHGEKIYLDGTGLWRLAGLSEYTAFVPTLSNATSGAAVASSGTPVGWYKEYGETIEYFGEITLAATTASGGIAVSLPVTAATRQLGFGSNALWGSGVPAGQTGKGYMTADRARMVIVDYTQAFLNGTSGQTMRWSVIYRKA